MYWGLQVIPREGIWKKKGGGKKQPPSLMTDFKRLTGKGGCWGRLLVNTNVFLIIRK